MDVSRLDRPVTCATMPRSFLIKKKNYSHCPLKKRPVHDFMIKAEDDDNSEPENLSTKPEDLSLSAAAASTVHCPKPLTPPAGVALISAAAAHGVAKAPTSTPPSTTPTVIVPQPTSAAVAAHHFLASKGGPLEPLSLNTAAPTPAAPSVDYLQPWHYHHHQPPPPPYMGWYPPHADHPALFHHHHPHYPAPPSAFSRHTPHHNHHHEPMSVSPPPAPPPHVFSPVAVVAASTPKLFLPYATPAGLSPTSSSGSFQQPPSPEDLSSPGSVSSASSGGSSGNGGGKKIRTPKDGSSQSGVGGRYQCPDCSKSYSTYSGLAKHRQFHCAAAGGLQATKKSFSCKFCEKVYVSLGALKMHIRTHTLPCKCTLCGKAFSRPWLLQGHIRTHTGEKPFSCPHCSRAFADRSNLRAHLQTHSDVKKYSCALCGKTFSRMSLLSKHADSGCPATPGGGNGLSGDQSTPPPQSPSDDSIYH